MGVVKPSDVCYSHIREVHRLIAKEEFAMQPMTSQMKDRIADIFTTALAPTQSYQHLFEHETNPERIRIFFRKRVEYILKHNSHIILSEDGNGVLVAFMPDIPKLTTWGLIKEGIDLVFSYKLSTMARMIKSVNGTGAMHTPEYDDYIILSVLAVRPQAQGRGVGSSLMKRFLTEFPNQKIKLDTASSRNERFYEKFGFRVAARGDCGVPVAMMVKP
jgi:ribosomal protein S18 acetylase RimI-like enzyme